MEWPVASNASQSFTWFTVFFLLPFNPRKFLMTYAQQFIPFSNYINFLSLPGFSLTASLFRLRPEILHAVHDGISKSNSVRSICERTPSERWISRASSTRRACTEDGQPVARTATAAGAARACIDQARSVRPAGRPADPRELTNWWSTVCIIMQVFGILSNCKLLADNR